MPYVDIPAHRVYVASGVEVASCFELLDEDGQVISPSIGVWPRPATVMLRRRSDGKLFRPARSFGSGMSVRLDTGGDAQVLEAV